MYDKKMKGMKDVRNKGRTEEKWNDELIVYRKGRMIIENEDCARGKMKEKMLRRGNE